MDKQENRLCELVNNVAYELKTSSVVGITAATLNQVSLADSGIAVYISVALSLYHTFNKPTLKKEYFFNTAITITTSAIAYNLTQLIFSYLSK